MIITYANLKGGSGKTTAAMFSAFALAEQNRDVVVVDADRQGSSIAWDTSARHLGENLPFEVVSLATSQLTSRIDQITQGKIGIIDCGPGDSDIIAAAIEVADVVVIPSNPRPDDLRQSEKMIRQCRTMDIPHGVLFSRNRTTESSADVWRSDYTSDGYHVFDTEINELVRIGNAWGSGSVDDVSPFDALLKEIEEMAS